MIEISKYIISNKQLVDEIIYTWFIIQEENFNFYIHQGSDVQLLPPDNEPMENSQEISRDELAPLKNLNSPPSVPCDSLPWRIHE